MDEVTLPDAQLLAASLADATEAEDASFLGTSASISMSYKHLERRGFLLKALRRLGSLVCFARSYSSNLLRL